MIKLIDFILDLFRDEDHAQAFVTNPEQALGGCRLVQRHFGATAVGGRDRGAEPGHGRRR